MYQGIVQGYSQIEKIKDLPGLRTLSIYFNDEQISELPLGSSVAVDGVCLTVAKIQNNLVSFDTMQETLNKTTLGIFKEGDFVNIERSAKFGDEIGGHEISGHVDTTAEIVSIETPENNHIITFKIPHPFAKFIFAKGYVAVNGASLTIVSPNNEAGTFKIYLIPETLRLTTFGRKVIGNKVNLEFDKKTQVIVETIERFLKNNTFTLE